MSENTAERPEQTAEGQEQLEERKDEKKVEVAPRPHDYVLVRHMSRSARTRTLRAARSGHRRQGVVLDNGKRIRRKGDRFTEVDLMDLVKNHQQFLEYVRVGALEVCNPQTEQAVSYDELVARIKGMGEELASRARHVMERYAGEKAEHEKDMEAYAKALGEWQREHAKAQKDGKKSPPAPEKPAAPSAPPPWATEFKLDLSGVQQDPVGGSDKVENSAPADQGSAPAPGEDATRVDLETMQEMAQSPEATGLLDDEGKDAAVEEPPAEETELTEEVEETDEEGEDEENGLTEEELMKMTRPQLNEAAKEYGVEDPESYATKGDVVEAIFALQNGEEG